MIPPTLATGDPQLRQRFLDGMSHAACSVHVVTTDGPGGRFGVTVSAMASVSADTAKPTLLVCIHHLSPTARAVLDNGVFCVNLLRDDQTHISEVFAGRLKTHNNDRFACARWTTQATGAPRVIDPLVAFDCRVTASERVGSHLVVFGYVEDIFIASAGTPLIYASRAYGTPQRFERRVALSSEPAAHPVLSLGCFQTFAPNVIPELVARLAKLHGGLKLKLVEADERGLLETLRRGESEVALLYDFGLGPDIEAEPLADVVPYVLLAEGHPLAAAAAISLQDLVPEPLILLDVEPSREYFRSLFANYGLEPTLGLRTSSFEMVRGLVSHGLGYGLLGTKPANNMSYDGRALVSRPLLTPVPPSRLVLARVAGRALTPIAADFAAECRDFFRTTGGDALEKTHAHSDP
jgi:flavin reductase (DIM6/NTAB) family NADH-FMN oxidoreductase RutF